MKTTIIGQDLCDNEGEQMKQWVKEQSVVVLPRDLIVKKNDITQWYGFTYAIRHPVIWLGFAEVAVTPWSRFNPMKSLYTCEVTPWRRCNALKFLSAMK